MVTLHLKFDVHIQIGQLYDQHNELQNSKYMRTLTKTANAVMFTV